MNSKKPDIDIINEVLEACILAYPVSSFVISLYKQYGERGSLSKKQLQGLHGKASKINDLAPGKLATLEAIINRMPTRFKSDIPETKAAAEKDETAGNMMNDILARYPQHKRVLFLRSKYDNNETLSALELSEINRFRQILQK